MTDTKKLNQRKSRIRAKVSGTPERPRLSVYVSNRYISCQIIDDTTGKTLAVSDGKAVKIDGSYIERAAGVGAEIAKAAQKAKIKHVTFDRNGKKYHGRIKALADSARAGGLEF